MKRTTTMNLESPQQSATFGSEDATSGYDELTGAEHFLIGLSPQYWAHTPMLVEQFHRLALVDGIDCILTTKQMPFNLKFVPVSKCTLVGMIVNVERKANGSILYVLDDGTGMVDCLQWTDNEQYRLPSLRSNNEYRSNHLTVGQLARVLGRIKVLAIGNVREIISLPGKTWEIRDATREVHVNAMEAIDNLQHRGMDSGPESLHWLKCMDFHKQCEHCKSIDGADQIIRNGTDVLRLLGPSIGKDVLARMNLPSTDDAIGAWKVFGTNCQCNLAYKESLLYCHCQATLEPLDPHFIFRDAILMKLLEDEAKSENNCIFLYRTILNDSSLETVASRILSKDEAGNRRRLFVNTFAALRKDGLIHLINTETDHYLLISREKVLEPYLAKTMDKSIDNMLQRNHLLNEEPAFLHHVPNARLQYIKRCMQDRAKNNNKVSLASILS